VVQATVNLLYHSLGSCWVLARDCNPGPVFLILGFGKEDFVIPGSCWDYGISPRIWTYRYNVGNMFKYRIDRYVVK